MYSSAHSDTNWGRAANIRPPPLYPGLRTTASTE